MWLREGDRRQKLLKRGIYRKGVEDGREEMEANLPDTMSWCTGFYGPGGLRTYLMGHIRGADECS